MVSYPAGYTYSFVMVLTRGATDGVSGNFRITVLRNRNGTPPLLGFSPGNPIGLHGTYDDGRLEIEIDEDAPATLRISIDPDGEQVGRLNRTGRLIGWLSEQQ